MKSPRPSPEQLRAAYGKTVADIIAPGLDVLFVGINPSLYSAVVGHHFARPGNRFWPALHRSGFLPRPLTPQQDQELLEYGIGLTNIARHATARGDEVTAEELARGRRTLIRKVRRHRPRSVAILGVTAYRIAFGAPKATMGPQDRSIGKAPVWVLPNPSGLNAHYQVADLAHVYGEFREWLAHEIDPAET